MKKLLLIIGLVAFGTFLKAQVINVNSDFIQNDLIIGTQKIAADTFNVVADSGFVYISFYTPSTNTGNIYFKGSYGVGLPFESSTNGNWGDKIKVIPECSIYSPAAADTVYIIVWKKL